MKRSVAVAVRKEEENDLSLPLLGEVPGRKDTGNSVADGLWILPIIARAIDRCMSRKEAAILMGMSEGYLSRLLSGDGHLSSVRLGALGERFWIAFRDELGIYFKLNDPAAQVQQAMDLVSRGVSLLVSQVQR